MVAFHAIDGAVDHQMAVSFHIADMLNTNPGVVGSGMRLQ
jgi:hypothetical protein